MANRQLTAEDREDLKVGRLIDEMMSTAGWKVYAQVLSRMLTAKRNELEQVSQPNLDGLAQVLVGENLKGSIIGIKLALELAPGMLNQAEMVRRETGLTAEDGEGE